MIAQLALRFVLGGAIVSLFSLAGDVFKPKTFGGLFGAAPSVALATLAMAFAAKGGGYVALEGRAMGVGAVAMGVYALLCVWLVKLDKLPPWAGATIAWSLWLFVAFGLKEAALRS